MASTFERIRDLVARREIRISEHGYDELAQDGILAREVISGVRSGRLIEEYPDYPKGPCVLVLQRDEAGGPIHVVWGIPKNRQFPAVLVTAYRPDPERWTPDFMRRRD
ncbi:MAG TPA: DUF4258 domain-containing protein [Thermoanaerobaculia bacterium]|nr:DUF4258 domain-containing protein [Thermoanaerobaculia bacterium]